MYAIEYVPASVGFVVGRIDNILPTESTASHGMVSGGVTSFIGTFDASRSQKDTLKLPHKAGFIVTPRLASLGQVKSFWGSPRL